MLQVFFIDNANKHLKGQKGRMGILSTHVGIVETLQKIKIFLL